MSDREQEMINSLRRAYDAFNRGDFDTAIDLAHPAIEYVPPGGQAPLRGVDAFRAWMEPDAFESQQVQPREFRINGNKALVRQRARARGAGSGVELDIEMCAVWTFDDDGLVTRAEAFLPHQDAEAAEAAGLSE
jgi:ketosteroid isomerase-like protein